jgi:hypothetical protein
MAADRVLQKAAASQLWMAKTININFEVEESVFSIKAQEQVRPRI